MTETQKSFLGQGRNIRRTKKIVVGHCLSIQKIIECFIEHFTF